MHDSRDSRLVLHLVLVVVHEAEEGLDEDQGEDDSAEDGVRVVVQLLSRQPSSSLFHNPESNNIARGEMLRGEDRDTYQVSGL